MSNSTAATPKGHWVRRGILAVLAVLAIVLFSTHHHVEGFFALAAFVLFGVVVLVVDVLGKGAHFVKSKL